jgi:hypothetical protein
VILATKADVENHFNTHGTGEITEIKLMNGFGFIEYKDAMDARDVVPGKSAPTPRAHRMRPPHDAYAFARITFPPSLPHTSRRPNT